MENDDEERKRRRTMENPRSGFDIELETDNCATTLCLDGDQVQNDGWLELGRHATNVDDGQLHPLHEEEAVVDDGQLSPLRENVVANGQMSALPKAVIVCYKDYGEQLLEIFSVRVMNVREQYGGRVYGEIKVSDVAKLADFIYNRDRENAESISSGDVALLISPTEIIPCYDSFRCDVSLVYEYNNRLLDDEVVSSRMQWWFWTRGYHTLTSKEVKGLFVRAKFYFVLMVDAVVATLEITLINSDEEIPAKLHGNLTARNSDFLDKFAESELFRKALGEEIVVRPGQLIPLSRSIVAVPLDSYLIVKADLWNSFNEDEDEDIKGVAVFSAQPWGTSEETLSGKYSEIKVKVTWGSWGGGVPYGIA